MNSPARPPSPFAVETRGLVKRFGGTVALAGVDLAIPAGSIFGVIGPNGAGKTTTMRLLLDIIRPTSGHLRVLGEDPRAGGPRLRSRIGFLPGEVSLPGQLTARRVLTDFARISGPVEPGRVDELAERLGLDLDRRVRQLSKGNRQKLSLAQAFLHRPRLLVLDEPTSGLDPLVQQEFQAMAREAAANGQTVFLSSHVLSEVQDTADSVAILRRGQVVKTATVTELRESAVRHLRVVTEGLTVAEALERLSRMPGVGGVTARTVDRPAGSLRVAPGRPVLHRSVRHSRGRRMPRHARRSRAAVRRRRRRAVPARPEPGGTQPGGSRAGALLRGAGV
ncbi:ABC transporter ATP-binding protein [Cryobacterium shii]|uniref:ABC transporter ATP-binding protein n=2 Tax=Cryobacterium TaxID=69578 RepID=UPI0015777C28|nr:ABC transporter ATP-binding protein [Cryobacterium shii]